MKKSFLLSVLFIAIIFQSQSQNYSLQWAKAMGGSLQDYGNSIAIDKNKNSITTGYFQSTVDFNPDSSATSNFTSYGMEDIYVSKLDANGNFLWAKNFGGKDSDNGTAVTVDTLGNIYVTGYFSDTATFDATSISGQLVSHGKRDIFVLKLDSNGNVLWFKQVGSLDEDSGAGIVTDKSGNAFITGDFSNFADFDPSSSSISFLTSAGGVDAFVLKLSSAGNFVWAKQFGGTGQDNGKSIDIDNLGKIFVTGTYNGSADFDPSSATALLTSNGASDVFLMKLNATGNYMWAKTFGGGAGDVSASLKLDSKANAFIVGYFQTTADFDPSASTANLVSAGNHDAFVAKIDSAGLYIWAKQFSGTNYEYAFDVTVDASDDVYVSGRYIGTLDFDPGSGVNNVTSNGTNDAYIVKLDIYGDFVWVYSFGGIGTDAVNSFVIDNNYNIYSTGIFIDTVDFNPTAAVYNLSAVGISDCFVQKLSQPITGINEYANNSLIKLFPNPSDGIINLQMNNNESKRIEIYNNLSQKVFELNTSNQSEMISLVSLEAGVYYITVKFGNSIASTKLIIN